ncbi:hypothetical protein tinsulaeT_09790 [Thalassotalea insulae]|uniref:VOC domain-containing protein n=1 Tax=Thalassotalea insulae TaxID=2056778 RepID=A0ABQ6GPU7_9GAMM|nr:hypothetical protein [Thalassotalea insulae]GLX77639.1 hypothetical protein tinsulaeT_09790 [Thalassotalea insulae]
MILGISHIISVNSNTPNAEVIFRETITNPSNKLLWMNSNSKIHTLTLFNSHPYQFEDIQYSDNIIPKGVGRFLLVDKKLSLFTNDIKAEVDFWVNQLGFKFDKTLKLVRPISNWNMELTLEYNEFLPPSYLDSKGLTCIAFLSKDVAGFREKMVRNGNQVTELFTVNINNKTLTIFIAKTPTGAYCEFIEVQDE